MTRPAVQRKPRRLRRAPRQVYLSESENETLEAILQRRGCTFAELVRRWILREQARYETRLSGPKPAPPDPRQTAIYVDGLNVFRR